MSEKWIVAKEGETLSGIYIVQFDIQEEVAVAVVEEKYCYNGEDLEKVVSRNGKDQILVMAKDKNQAVGIANKIYGDYIESKKLRCPCCKESNYAFIDVCSWGGGEYSGARITNGTKHNNLLVCKSCGTVYVPLRWFEE